MKFDWPDAHCILCRVEGHPTPEGHLTEEHIIPRVIGGILTCNFLCKNCNSVLGWHEAKLKEDPSIRLAIENLRDQIPWIYQRISLRQNFNGLSGGGLVEGFYRKDESNGELRFQVRASQKPDDSRVLPTDDARKCLPEMLRKEGKNDAEIELAIRSLDEAPENVRVEVAPGFDIANWTVNRVDPQMDGRQLLVRLGKGGEEVLVGAGIVLLKIAFEYLALHIGTNIFDCVFDPVRDALLRNDASLSPHRIEWKRGPKVDPFHGLIVERKPSYVVVQIRFFSEVIYRVHFPQLTPGEAFQRYQYTHDLIQGTERCQNL